MLNISVNAVNLLADTFIAAEEIPIFCLVPPKGVSAKCILFFLILRFSASNKTCFSCIVNGEAIAKAFIVSSRLCFSSAFQLYSKFTQPRFTGFTQYIPAYPGSPGSLISAAEKENARQLAEVTAAAAAVEQQATAVHVAALITQFEDRQKAAEAQSTAAALKMEKQLTASVKQHARLMNCLLYTSDAADE